MNLLNTGKRRLLKKVREHRLVKIKNEYIGKVKTEEG